MKTTREPLFWIRTRREYGWGYYVSVFGSPVPCWTAVPGRGTLLDAADALRAIAALRKRFNIEAETEVA